MLLQSLSLYVDVERIMVLRRNSPAQDENVDIYIDIYKNYDNNHITIFYFHVHFFG